MSQRSILSLSVVALILCAGMFAGGNVPNIAISASSGAAVSSDFVELIPLASMGKKRERASTGPGMSWRLILPAPKNTPSLM